MLEIGSAYLRLTGPFYGFFGLGMAIYFASQGAGRLAWPLLAAVLRMLIAVAGGWLAPAMDRIDRLGFPRARRRIAGDGRGERVRPGRRRLVQDILRMNELYFEDFHPGLDLHLANRPVTRDRIVAFAEEFDPQAGASQRGARPPTANSAS